VDSESWLGLAIAIGVGLYVLYALFGAEEM